MIGLNRFIPSPREIIAKAPIRGIFVPFVRIDRIYGVQAQGRPKDGTLSSHFA